MLKIISPTLLKMSQTFLDEVRDDLGDDQKVEKRVNDNNYNNYLVDDVEPELLPQLQPQQQDVGNEWLDEIPMGSQALGIPEGTVEQTYENPLDLVYDGIDRNEVISFHYSTRGYGNKPGHYAGKRTVEPHYTFIAQTTGNEVLVSFDRDVNDIRAFIVGNIGHNGVRYEGVKFEDRPEIMVGIV